MTKPKPISCTKEQLYQWYVVEKRSYRFIMKAIGRNNARVVRKILESNGIPVRRGSDAVATQWIDADWRREKARHNPWLAPYRSMPRSEECKRKQSIVKMGKKNPMWGKSGPLSANFLGGKSTWAKGRRIDDKRKKIIIAQLGGKCTRCGTPENLTINHKIPWRECRHHELWNLEPLCKKCHFQGPIRLR